MRHNRNLHTVVTSSATARSPRVPPRLQRPPAVTKALPCSGDVWRCGDRQVAGERVPAFHQAVWQFGEARERERVVRWVAGGGGVGAGGGPARRGGARQGRQSRSAYPVRSAARSRRLRTLKSRCRNACCRRRVWRGTIACLQSGISTEEWPLIFSAVE